MKYITKLTCEEIIEKLGQRTDRNFKLEKENENIKDKIYILSMNNKVFSHCKYICEEAQYRLLVTPAQEGSTVWLYLYQCSNKYALNQYAEKLKKFMEKRIDALRVE